MRSRLRCVLSVSFCMSHIIATEFQFFSYPQNVLIIDRGETHTINNIMIFIPHKSCFLFSLKVILNALQSDLKLGKRNLFMQYWSLNASLF